MRLFFQKVSNSTFYFLFSRFCLVILLSTFYFLFSDSSALASSGSSFKIKINPVPFCGDGSCNSNETCNNCSTDCGSCPGGGGAGTPERGSPTSSVTTSVIFNGRAYPKSAVTLLRDAQVAATTIAGSDSNFEIDLSGLAGGNYIFSLYSEDYQGIRSALLTFLVSITRGATTQISDIFIAPTIEVDKSEVKKGDNLAIFGQSTGGGEITFVVHSPEEIFFKTRADKNGVYLYNFNTASLEYGYHFTKAKAARDGQISIFSKAVGFQVGTKTIRKKITKALKGDFNGDGRVNLVDFSIAAYWYQRLSPPAKVDLNSDGKVNLVDLSIMAYYWTG